MWGELLTWERRGGNGRCVWSMSSKIKIGGDEGGVVSVVGLGVGAEARRDLIP
jgi:hypothetical protein